MLDIVVFNASVRLLVNGVTILTGIVIEWLHPNHQLPFCDVCHLRIAFAHNLAALNAGARRLAMQSLYDRKIDLGPLAHQREDLRV